MTLIGIEPRKGTRIFKDAEWVIHVDLVIGNDEPALSFDMHYSDSYFGKLPVEVGRLMAARMQEAAVNYKKPRKR